MALRRPRAAACVAGRLTGGNWLARAAVAAGLAGTPAAAQDTILVTGSRIPRTPAEAATGAATPLARYDASRAEDRVLTNIADALNETPGIRSSVTPAYTQASFGQGVNFLNIYNLGSNRTLVLVDGQRMAGSNVPTALAGANPGTQIDLNAVPAILVERVERIAAGGAPAYGSDAIAGTINIVLRRDASGLETRAAAGLTARGDNLRRSLAMLGGTGFAGGRGHITASASFEQVDPVIASQRGAYRAGLGNAPNPCTPAGCSAFNRVALLGPPGRTPANDGRVNPAIGFNDSPSDGNPGSVLVRGLALPIVAASGVLASGPGAYGWQFAPDGRLVPYDKGVVFGAPVPGPLAAAAAASGGDGLRPFDYLPLASRLRRMNASLSLRYALAPEVELFADTLAYAGRAREPIDLPGFNAPLFRGASGPLTFRTDNPLLTAQARAQLAALGYGATFQLSRANADLADTSGAARSRVWRLLAGARGTLRIGASAYRFEVTANLGRSRITDIGQAIDQQRFVNAINVALVNGIAACTTQPVVGGLPAGQVPVADAACVPLNLFGAGAPSSAALAYVLRDTRAVSTLGQFVASANLAGSPFAVFGNPVSFAVGAEHHTERAAFRPDDFLRAGRGRAVPIAPVAGRYRLAEVFGEALLPLITPANAAPIAGLELFARARRVESSATASFTAWSAGGRIIPVAGLTLRGNLTRSLRAPSILELFAPRSPAALAVPDLCAPSAIGAGPVPAIRTANCTAFLSLYPAASPLIAATATVPGLTGGNPALLNERARSLSWGVVLEPRALPGLTLTADYIRIRLRDPIASLSVAEIAQGCFDNPEFDTADPAAGNAFCRLIRRDASGQVISDSASPAVFSGYVNGKRIALQTVEATLEYRTGLERLGLPGALSLGGALFHVRRRLVDITGVAPARSDGTVGDPRWQGQLRLRYAAPGWGLASQLQWTGRQALARDRRGPAPNDAREIDHFPAFATLDASAFVEAGGGFRLTLAVTNLFDRIGYRYRGAIVPLSINDPLGRRLAVSVARQW